MKACNCKAIMFIAISLLVATTSHAAQIAEGLDLSGFVDASYFNNPGENTSTFTLDQVELDIENNIDDVWGFRADINHLEGAEATTDNIIEQGFAWYSLAPMAKATFGKFNAPIGFEMLDPIDMYQYSHAMVFDYGIPTNLTGLMLSGGKGLFDYAIYVVNGWDQISDDNNDKTVGGRLGVTPMDGASIGFSYITGKEGDDAGGAETSNLAVFDIDFSYTGLENLIIGAEFNSGTFDNASEVKAGDDASWTGFLVMANYAFTDKVALTLRYDEFDDKDGARLGSGVSEKRKSFTISPSYAVTEGLDVLAEYRFTSSDENVFAKADGTLEDTLNELAIELIASF